MHAVRNVRVFGSVARDEDTADGDIDLLADVRDEAHVLDIHAFGEFIVPMLGERLAEIAIKDRSGQVRGEVPVDLDAAAGDVVELVLAELGQVDLGRCGRGPVARRFGHGHRVGCLVLSG